MIPTLQAAQLLRVSRSIYLRYTKHFGLAPISRRLTGGQAEGLWSKVQVLSMMIAGQLSRLGVSEDWCRGFPALLAGSYTDETLEAAIELEGRKYLLVAGASVLPCLMSAAEVDERLEENKDTLQTLQIPTSRLDISPLFNDLLACVRFLRSAEEFA